MQLLELTQLTQLRSTELTAINTSTEVTELMEVSDLMQEVVTLELFAEAVTEVVATLGMPPLILSTASSLSRWWSSQKLTDAAQLTQLTLDGRRRRRRRC